VACLLGSCHTEGTQEAILYYHVFPGTTCSARVRNVTGVSAVALVKTSVRLVFECLWFTSHPVVFHAHIPLAFKKGYVYCCLQDNKIKKQASLLFLRAHL
jgi:hypothetical protein